MLEAAITKYNWAYLDGYEYDVDLRTFWLFMLWRIQEHGSIDQLTEEVAIALPDLLQQFSTDNYVEPQEQMNILIELRFIIRFLEFWGLVTVKSTGAFSKLHEPKKLTIQPLLKHTFQFTIKN